MSKTKKSNQAVETSSGSFQQPWQYDHATGALIRRTSNTLGGESVGRIPLEIRKEGNKHVAYLPALAGGGSVESAIASVDDVYEYDAFSFAQWDLMDGINNCKQEMVKAVSYWRRDPVVYKCVKFLTHLSNGKVIFESETPAAQQVIETWFNQAMSTTFREQWYREYFRSGMVPALKALMPYRPRDLKNNKIPKSGSDNVSARATASVLARCKKLEAEHNAALKNYERALAKHKEGRITDDQLEAKAALVVDSQYKWSKSMIPAAYTLLNPLQVDIEGPEALSLLHMPYLRVGDDLRRVVNNPTPQQKTMVDALPGEIVAQIRTRSGKKIWLSPNICAVTFADKQPYERYPVPMISHAFNALEMKNQLLLADKKTAASIRNRILKVTIGSDMFPVVDQSELNLIRNVFQNNTGNMTIFWNHTLNIEWISPAVDGWMEAAKYQLWDDQILACFGVSRVFLGTAPGTSTGSSIMNFKGVEEEVNGARDAFLEFLRREIEMLRASLSISADVNIRYSSMSLRDEAEYIGVLTQAVMNGLLDPQSALESMNFHFPTVLSRQKIAKALRAEGLFLPTPSANNLGPGGGAGPQGGKPPNKPNADNNKNKVGKSQPKSKTTARFVLTPDQQDFRFVVLDGEVDDEARASLASSLAIEPDKVATASEYESAFGEMPAVASLPELSPAEAAASTRKAMGLVAAAEKLTEERCRLFKEGQDHEGKRGPYLTPKRRQEIGEKAYVETIAGYAVDVPEWDKAVSLSTAEMIASDPELDPRTAHAIAMVITKARYAKCSPRGQM